MAKGFITFANEPAFTFVHYGHDLDLKYRPEARRHNCHRRSVESNKRHEDQSRQRQLEWSSFRPLQDPTTSFARDPFTTGPATQARSLESIWLSNFEANFCLPLEFSIRGYCQNPADVILSSARSSHTTFQNLITLTAATVQARQDVGWEEEVYARQAITIKEFASAMDYYQQSECTLSPRNINDLYSALYSFSAPVFGRQQGFHALVSSSLTCIFAKHNHNVMQLPTVEWIRTLMPRPDKRFQRPQPYQNFMLWKINCFLDFLEGAQQEFCARFDQRQSSYFACSKDVYQLLRCAFESRPVQEPYKGFYWVCVNRILLVLLSYQQTFAKSAERTDVSFVEAVDNLARKCSAFPMLQALTAFLWGLFSLVDGKQWAQRQQLFTVPLKELLVGHEYNFAPEMMSWIFFDPTDSESRLPTLLDFGNLRQILKALYSPGLVNDDVAASEMPQTCYLA
ncbi:MAG: hypothetical protein Q9159_004406 [Coniocarpon cinnabarinum]